MKTEPKQPKNARQAFTEERFALVAYREAKLHREESDREHV